MIDPFYHQYLKFSQKITHFFSIKYQKPEINNIFNTPIDFLSRVQKHSMQ